MAEHDWNAALDECTICKARGAGSLECAGSEVAALRDAMLEIYKLWLHGGLDPISADVYERNRERRGRIEKMADIARGWLPDRADFTKPGQLITKVVNSDGARS